jgi:epoxyqueuosine reductase QueG
MSRAVGLKDERRYILILTIDDGCTSLRKAFRQALDKCTQYCSTDRYIQVIRRIPLRIDSLLASRVLERSTIYRDCGVTSWIFPMVFWEIGSPDSY